MNNSNNIEQVVALKDGRTIYKTNNGFTSWVKNTKGISSEVSYEYYLMALKNRVSAKAR